MKCPECSSAMRITCSGQRRYWECTSWFSNRCYKTVPIEIDQQLDIKEIAEDLAREAFGSSDARAKEQAKYRRIAGGINNTLSNKYISADERSTLIAASRILERLATAAERAKKERKRIEEEAEQRRQRREREANTLLYTRFGEEMVGLRDKAITLLTFCRMNNTIQRIEIKDIEDAIKFGHQHDKDVLQVLDSRISNGIKDEFRWTAADMAISRDRGVEELFKRVCENYETEKGKVISVNKGVLDRLDEVIAIYQSEQVIPFKHKKVARKIS